VGVKMGAEQYRPTVADWTVVAFGVRRILRTRPGQEWLRAAAKIAFALLLACYFASETAGKQPQARSATVRGSVFVQDSGGNQSPVAGAKVQLRGPATLEA